MNNTTDTFEQIAQDAVILLTAIIADLADSEDEADQLAALLIGATTETFCDRAIALGAP